MIINTDTNKTNNYTADQSVNKKISPSKTKFPPLFNPTVMSTFNPTFNSPSMHTSAVLPSSGNSSLMKDMSMLTFNTPVNKSSAFKSGTIFKNMFGKDGGSIINNISSRRSVKKTHSDNIIMAKTKSETKFIEYKAEAAYGPKSPIAERSGEFEGNKNIHLSGEIQKRNSDFNAGCTLCPHCRLKSGEGAELKQKFKKILQESHLFENTFKMGANKELNESKIAEWMKNSFANLEPTNNRKDAVLFNNLIEQLIDNKIRIDDLFDKETLNEMLENSMYKGISIDDKYEGTRDVKNKGGDKDEDMLDMNEFKKRIEMKANEVHQKRDLTSMILYIGFQEIVRQISVNCKERGYLLLKIFKRYFEENEKKWRDILKKLEGTLNSMKDKHDQMLGKYFGGEQDLHKVLLLDDVNQENLGKHKDLIRRLLGLVKNEESKRFLIEMEKNSLEKDIKKLMFNWDSLKVSSLHKERIQSIDADALFKQFAGLDENSDLTREELVVLVNAERMFKSIRRKNKFEVEKDLAEAESAQLRKEKKKLYFDISVHEQRISQLEIETKQKNHDIDSLKKSLNAANMKIKIKEGEEKAVQTIVSSKDFESIEKMSVIHEQKVQQKSRKVAKIFERVSFNLAEEKEMSHSDMIDLIATTYNKRKSSYNLSSKKELQYDFDDFFYNEILMKRFGVKKVVKKKCESFLITLGKYSGDERIDAFGGFLGIKEKKLTKEILDFYLKIFACFHESYATLLSKHAEEISVEIDEIYQKLEIIFRNSTIPFKMELYQKLVYESYIVCNDIRITELSSSSDKIQVALLLEFYKNAKKHVSKGYISLINKIKNPDTDSVKAHDLKKTIKMFMDNEFIEEVYDGAIKTFFISKKTKNTDQIRVKDINKFFYKNYCMKINLRKVLEVGLNSAKKFYDEVKFFIKEIFDKYDQDHDNFLFVNEFYEVIKLLDPNKPQWKLIALYKDTADSDNKVSFDNFLSLCLDHELMLGWSKVTHANEDECILPPE